MGSERKRGVRGGENSSWVFKFQRWQKPFCSCQNGNFAYPHKRLVRGSRAGHRGYARHLWWRGPREPPALRAGLKRAGAITLFIDGIPKKVSYGELKKVFSEVGMVVDSYISMKQRKNRRENFGFIRFHHCEEAELAVKRFNGQVIFGSRIRVSWAKYQKDGTPVSFNHKVVRLCNPVSHHRKRLSSWVPRRVSDEGFGKQRNDMVTDEVQSVPPVSSIKIPEVCDIADNMRKEENDDGIAKVISTDLAPQKTQVSNSSHAEMVEDEERHNKSLINVSKQGGEKICVVNSETPPATPENIKPAARGDFGKKQAGRPGNLRKLMNSRDIKIFLGYYGPPKT